MANPKRSINSCLQLVKAWAGEIEEVLNTIPSGSRPSSRVVARIEDLEKMFKDQMYRLEYKYASILEESDLEEKDEDEVKKIYGKAKREVDFLSRTLIFNSSLILSRTLGEP